MNLIVNGDFSQSSYYTTKTKHHRTTYTYHSSQFGTPYGGQGVTGWVGGDGYQLWMIGSTSTTVSADNQWGSSKEKLYGPSGGDAPPGGGNFIAMDADQDPSIQGTITQTVNGLIPGLIYQLNFQWAGAQLQSKTGDTTEQLRVTFGDQTQSTSVVSNASESFTGWMSASMTFTAAYATQALTFLAVGTPGGLPPTATLASVTLYQVPEPMTLALLGSGLAGLVMTRRRKRRA